MSDDLGSNSAMTQIAMGNSGSSVNVMGPAVGKQGMGGMIGGELGKSMQNATIETVFSFGKGISLVTDSSGGGLDSNPFDAIETAAPAKIGHQGFDYASLADLTMKNELGDVRPSSLTPSKSNEQGQSIG